MSSVATIRLNAQQTEEMGVLGFSNPSQYIKYKLGETTPEEAALQIEGLSGAQGHIKYEGPQNIQDAVRLAKAEAEAERLRTELNALRGSSSETLGKLDSEINARVEAQLKQIEHLQLKHDKDKLVLEAKQKDIELEGLKNELEETKSKIKTMEVIKQFTPAVQPILAGIGRGIAAIQSGGGFAGFLGGFEAIGDVESKLSAEDESSLELGKNIQSMFTDQELQQVLYSVAIMGRDKSLITQLPRLIAKLAEEKNKKPEFTPPASNDDFQEEEFEEEDEFPNDNPEFN